MTVTRNVRSWIALLSLSLFVTGSVLAQAPQAPTGSKPGQTAATGAKGTKGKKGQKGRQTPLLQALGTLTLTPDQKAKIMPLAAKYREETKGATVTPQVRREKSKKLQADIAAILTPEQQAKFKVAMARLNGPMASAARELKLTPEQRTKIMPIAQKANEDIAKLNADKLLKGKAKREKVQSIVKAAVASIKAQGGLTDEQKTKLDTIAAKIGQRKAKTAAGAAKTAKAAPAAK